MLGATTSTETATYDPYHHCRGGWATCCAMNAKLLRDAFQPTPGRKYVGRLCYTYRDWLWFNEVFFEQLPRPAPSGDDARSTMCGLCPVCVTGMDRDGRRCYVCPFPQPPGTYARWHARRTREWSV